MLQEVKIMWNNLRSDIYRITHMKSFYITLGVLILLNVQLIVSDGLQISAGFGTFSRANDTFADFLYYIFKTPTFILAITIFLCIFHNDEYDKGFAKNVMPIMNKKWVLIVERYLVSLVITLGLSLAIIICCVAVNMLMPNALLQGPIDIGHFAIYAVTQCLIVCSFVSMLVFLNHLLRSRILIILLSCFFSLFVFYIIENSISTMLLGNSDLLNVTMYYSIQTLPKVFTFEAYKMVFLIIGVNTVLWNALSYAVVKKKDI